MIRAPNGELAAKKYQYINQTLFILSNPQCKIFDVFNPVQIGSNTTKMNIFGSLQTG